MIDREVFSKLRDEISRERGDLSLFALVLREDADNWDLVLAAPWAENDDWGHALRYVSQKVMERLKPSELMDLSRIVVLNERDLVLEAFLRTVHVENGKIIELPASTTFGLPIKSALVFQAKRTEVPAHAGA
jgi:hypothetical protein